MTEDEFLALIKENKGIILKLVNLYARDTEEKKDLYQEIMYQGWKNAPAYRGEAKFGTWLYRLCLNTILTQKRRKQPVEYKHNLENIAPAVAISAMDENAQQLYVAIKHLGETEKAIITMHLDGYSNDEISEVMGISYGNVTVKISRIKNNLKQFIKTEQDGTNR